MKKSPGRCRGIVIFGSGSFATTWLRMTRVAALGAEAVLFLCGEIKLQKTATACRD